MTSVWLDPGPALRAVRDDEKYGVRAVRDDVGERVLRAPRDDVKKKTRADWDDIGEKVCGVWDNGKKSAPAFLAVIPAEAGIQRSLRGVRRMVRSF